HHVGVHLAGLPVRAQLARRVEAAAPFVTRHVDQPDSGEVESVEQRAVRGAPASTPSPRRVVLMPHNTYPPRPAAAIWVSMSGVLGSSVPMCIGRAGSAIASSAAAAAVASRRCSRQVHWRSSYFTATESSLERSRSSCWTVSATASVCSVRRGSVDGSQPDRHGALLQLFARKGASNR